MPVTVYYLPTVATQYSGANAWTNVNEVKTDDDLFAYATCSRSLAYPDGYESAPTNTLLGETFTGIATGIALGDTIDGIEIEVRAKQSRADVDVVLHLNTGFGTSAVESQLLTNAWATYTFGGASYTHGFDDYNLSAATVLTTLSIPFSAEMTSGNGSATVSIEYIKVRVYWRDTACDAFTFTTVNSQPLGEWIYSNSITVAGMPADFEAPTSFPAVSATHAYRSAIEAMHNNDGRWRPAIALATERSVNGDTWQLRRKLHYARAADELYASYPLFINGMSATWQVTSVAVDRTIPTISPRDTAGLPRSTTVKVPYTYTTDGVNAIAVSGDAYAAGMFAWFPAPTVNSLMRLTHKRYPYAANPHIEGPYDETYVWGCYEGTQVEYWITTPAGFGAASTADFFLGDQQPTWTFTTEIADVIPTQAYFTTPAPANTSTVTESNEVTIAGINDTATVTFSTSGGTAHEFQKNGGAWTAVGGGTTVANGNTIKLRMTSPGSGSQSGNVTMKIGTMHATFCLVTTGGDVTPDAFSFTDVTSAIPGLLYTSNAQVLAGTTAAQPMLATVSPGFEIRVGAGAWTASSLSVVAGDSITIRGYAPLQAGTTATCVVTIGGTQDTWTIATRAVHAFWD